MSHADTDEKEELLRLSILSLKRQGYPVIVSSHIPVSKRIHDIADYVVFDKENPIVYSDEFASLSNTSPCMFIRFNEFELSYSFDFNHGYAALKLIKNGLSIASVNKYEKVHFVNYDYVIKDPSVLENHSTKLEEFDVFSYNWAVGTSELNSALFSGKTDLILKSLEGFNSKEDYFSFPGITILEGFLYKAFIDSELSICLDDIKEISDKNSLNSYILPTYPYIKTKSKNPSYLYLTKELETREYILCAMGSPEEPLKFIIEYAGHKSEFIADPRQKPIILLSIPEKMLEEGFLVNLPDNNERRKYDISTKVADCILRNRDWLDFLVFENRKKINVDFSNGPKVEILGSGKGLFQVDFINNKNKEVLFSSNIGINCWTTCSIKYYVDWIIRITDLLTGDIEEHKLDLKGKKVKISLESSSLGDSISWFAHIEEFQKKHECKVYVSTFKNDLFESNYPNLHFLKPGQSPSNTYVTYQIGWFYNGSDFDSHLNPRDFKKIPMQSTTTDILGLKHTSLRPRIVKPISSRPIEEPYVCIGIHSTAQAKYWNNPTGWQEVTDYFLGKGYKVVMLSLEEDGYMGNILPKGITKINEERTLTNTINYLQHSEMFIGIGSGLSWLSWAINVPTVIISGFSTPMTEALDENVIRIFNGSVCNGCFNRHRLDAGDWNWCPDHKGTPRQFECSKSITGGDVISAIEEFYSNEKISKKNVDVIVQESYDLGMVQNHKEIFEAAEFFKNLKVKNFMEIGTDQGGTFAIWSKLSKDGKRISVDMPHGAYGVNTYDVNERDNYLRSLGSDVTMFHGSSHEESMKDRVKENLNGIELDFLFIDGDHTYEGVKQDYEMYKEFVKPGGWIGFHDTKDTEYHRNSNCGVDKLWSELKGNKYDFIEPNSNFGGIGFIQHKPKKSCLLAHSYFGDRRLYFKEYDEDRLFFIKKQVEYLTRFKHNLDHIVFTINTNSTLDEINYIIKAKDVIPSKIQGATVEIIVRENIGLSYGAFSDVYEKYRTEFDYYFFMEDDHVYVKENFDEIMIDILNETENPGYLCGIVRDEQTGWQKHAGNATGVITSKALETLFLKNNCLPSNKNKFDGYKNEENLGQISQSHEIYKLGFDLIDIREHYRISHLHPDGEYELRFENNEDEIIVPIHLIVQRESK
jgi:autotransporter strand-loop-strand O-heptosyltransferase